MLIIDCKYRLTSKDMKYTGAAELKAEKRKGGKEETEDLLLEETVPNGASLVQIEEPFIPKV